MLPKLVAFDLDGTIRWANECLDLFESKNGSKLASFVDVSKGKQIFKANKQRHFEKLQKMYPSVSYNEMLFFDNEKRNIETSALLA